MERNHIYIISGLANFKIKKSEYSWGYSYDELVTFGFFLNKTDAVATVESNLQNIGKDGNYKYIIIEEYTEGILPNKCIETSWYLWDDKNSRYHKMDNPTRGMTDWAFS